LIWIKFFAAIAICDFALQHNASDAIPDVPRDALRV
jgi:hypothetical protein